MLDNVQAASPTDNSSKILSLRLPPQIYFALKNKGAKFGLKPATFAKYAVISMLMNSRIEFNAPYDAQFNNFLSSLPQTKLDEKEVMDLVEKERQGVYESAS